MKSLHARFAALLTIAIVAVVATAAFVTLQIVDRTYDNSLSLSFAQEVAVVSKLVDGMPQRAREAGISVGPPPQNDDILPGAARRLGQGMQSEGSDVPVHIVSAEGGQRRITFPITSEEWAYLIYPGTRTSFLRPLTTNLMLVTLGAIVISLVAAARLTGPLRMLREALAGVRPDGTLAPIREKGPAEVRATAKALNELSARLTAALESRMRLVAAAGHDLRTPMTRMRLRTEFLPDEERVMWLRDLDELELIADSAIRLVREEAAGDTYEPVSVTEVMETIVEELEDLGQVATLNNGDDYFVLAQPFALKRALRNLVENAAIHGNRAAITLSRRTDYIVILIDDEGPGIPEDLLTRVFEPFFRADPGRHKSWGGAGLGLAIARQIVERNGGAISIQNRKGGGLRQEVLLPAA